MRIIDSERSVLQFVKAQGIAPGIVVGRMQLEGMIRYSMLNNLKDKYEIAVQRKYLSRIF